MSKFFRSISSSSSSSDQSDPEHTGELDQTSTNNTLPDSAATLSRSNHISPTLSEDTVHNGPKQSLLFHALLEYWALNETANEQRHANHDGVNDSDVEARGEAKYQSLVSKLASFGMVPPGFENRELASTRKNYRDGLKAFAQGPSSESAQQSNVPPMMRRLLTGANDSPLPTMQALQFGLRPSDSFSLPTPQFPSHSLIQNSRFDRDFEELGILGRGGYGIVHRVKHRLDGREYAVKKVPISASRLQRIKLRGSSEMDDLLLEVKTLADLEHHNIVRYYSSWIEWAYVGYSPSSAIDAPARQGDYPELHHWPHAVHGATDARYSDPASFGQIATVDSPDDIVFEDSGSVHSTRSRKSTLTAVSSESQEANNLTKVRSLGTAATVSDEDDVESITRGSDTSASFATDGGGTLMKTEPTLALHIQMSLYPLTLGDFLSPPPASHEQVVAPLHHCFHLQPSIHILLAVLDGLDYLHSQSIVHRDIKPGNIFMAAPESHRDTTGAVDLFLCNDCRAQGTAQPVMTKIRIGDFGLVTTIAGEREPEPSPDEAVGTALYRPDSGKARAGRHLDIFALGIVAFELLWKFDTRMERLETLQKLKQGCFPSDFAEKCAHGSKEMEQCIRSMLFSDRASGLTIDDIKSHLRRMTNL